MEAASKRMAAIGSEVLQAVPHPLKNNKASMRVWASRAACRVWRVACEVEVVCLGRVEAAADSPATRSAQDVKELTEDELEKMRTAIVIKT